MRHKITKYPGMCYKVQNSKTRPGKEEKVYYLYCRIDGKVREERIGGEHSGMTAAKAYQYVIGRREGRILSPKDRREAEEAAKRAEESRYTIGRLWESYRSGVAMKGEYTDNNRYKLYLKKPFNNKQANEIKLMDVERVRINMVKAGKSPQTIKHVLNLLVRITNYGFNHELSDQLTFSMKPIYKKVKVRNEKIEELTPEQLSRLLETIEADKHPVAGSMMLMALFSGMRRGEMFNLRWSDIDFDRKLIWIRDPKNEDPQSIPLNEAAEDVLNKLERTSVWVFPGRDGNKRVSISKAARDIKEAAELPADFRPLHGLRHVFASLLASSGEVDMYHLQKLLTHKSPKMTQRYAHLADKAKQEASNKIGDIVKRTANL